MRKLPLILALAALLLTGCAGKPAAEIIPAEAAKTILSEVTFRDQLVEAQGEVAGEWYDLDGAVTDFAIYISGSGATAEEIAVIKTGDLKSARAAVDKRIEDLKFRYEDYVPAEMTKLENPVIVTKGDTIVMILADDGAQAQKVADGLFK